MKKNNIFSDEENIEISLTPLIDTTLVLLVVFILVSPQFEHILKIYIPSATTVASVERNDYFCIAINQHGILFTKNKEKKTIQELKRLLLLYKEKHPKGVVVLFADKDLLLHQVTSIVDSIYSIGIDNVSIKAKKIEF
jgi:biopolymer transport protein ExbD